MFSLVSARCSAAAPAAVTFVLDRGWQCRIEPLESWCMRVRFLPPGGAREPRTWTIAPHGADVPWAGRARDDRSGFANPESKVVESAGAVDIAVGDMRVRVRLDPFQLSWTDASGAAFAADRGSQAYQASERVATLRHWMAREPSRQYFGLGDKTGPLNLHGRRLRTLQMDALGYNGESSDPLYKHWPFYIGRDPHAGIAYGVYYDTQSTCTFDFGAEYDNYHGFYSTVEIEDGDLDYYVFIGPRLRDVVARFAELTGRMAMGPRWSLGYANTAMGLTDAPDGQAQLSGFIDRAQSENIPVSAFHYGSGYSSRGPRRYVFTWNHDKFPDPKALNAKFRAADIRLVANIKPCLLDDHPAYAEVAAARAFVNDAQTGTPCVGQFWDGHGAHVDFTHPEGVRWWQNGLREQVLAYGIDAGWNDNNEYEIWDDWGAAHGFGQPIPIGRSRPLQALLMTRASCEEQARWKPDERVFSVTRAGCPGIQRHAQSWTGDNTTSWHTLKWNIRMGLTMSLSGLFNTGHDIGGFAGPVPDPELLARWMQSGALNPRCIMNSWKSDGRTNTPWLHPEVTANIRETIRLRYRLLPYLYTQYWRAATFGEPILRPTFYEFEDDDQAFADCDDFMVGNALLVAPVVAPGATERHVYLPTAGDGSTEWVDFHTGEYHAGGENVTVDAPLDRLPMFVRGGAVLPITNSLDFSRLHDEPSRLLCLYPLRNSNAAGFASGLYEDDGLTHAHRDGDWTLFEFATETAADFVRLTIGRTGNFALPYDSFRIALPPGDARRLEVDGNPGVRWDRAD
jgi:alpha-glucosidase